MGHLHLIYHDNAEQGRFDKLLDGSTPSPWEWPVGSFMCVIVNHINIWWYTRKSADYGWEPVEIKDVPKIYRLLFLLE